MITTGEWKSQGLARHSVNASKNIALLFLKFSYLQEKL